MRLQNRSDAGGQEEPAPGGEHSDPSGLVSFQPILVQERVGKVNSEPRRDVETFDGHIYMETFEVKRLTD